MSDLFIVPEEKINRNPQASFRLDTDVYRGFVTAVNNNQMRLAMEYLRHVIDCLAAAANSPVEEEPAPKQLPAKKSAPKTATAEGAVAGESTTSEA